MSERFNWDTANRIAAAFELKRRAESDPKLKLEARKDVIFNCVVCGKKPKKGDIYYKAFPTSDKNKVGHADCVDSTCAQQTAKTTGALRELESRGLLHPPVETILNKYRMKFTQLLEEMYKELNHDSTDAWKQIFSIAEQHVGKDKQSA